MIEIHLWDHNYDPDPSSCSSTLKLETLHLFMRAFTRITGQECSVKPPEALWSYVQQTAEIRASRCGELITRLDTTNAHIIFLHCSFERRALSDHLSQAANSRTLKVALLHFSDNAVPDENCWGYPNQNHFRGLVRWLGRRLSSDEYLLELAAFLSK